MAASACTATNTRCEQPLKPNTYYYMSNGKAAQLITLPEYFLHWEKTQPDAPFLRQPAGGQWKTLSWSEAGKQIRQIAAAIHTLGLEPGDKIGIVSKNCYHWIIADLAIMFGGWVSVPFYPNLNGRQLEEVVRAGDIKLLFVGKLDNWPEMKTGIPPDLPIIRFPHYPGNSIVQDGLDWDNILQTSYLIPELALPKLADLWTILFTSGTTGTPKGVMLDFAAPAKLMANEQQYNTLNIFGGSDHRFFSYLPLNHIAERIIVEVAALITGGTISFAESLDTFAENLRQTQPTLFMAVPRIWTKFQMGILQRMPEKRLVTLLKIPIINGAIRKKIKKGLGLDKARIMLTGAAPTPDALKNFFEALGIRLQEVYGMTENCGGCTLMPVDGIKAGVVGKPLPNVEIRIAPENGEVLMRVPWMMLGYYGAPEKTADVLRDGWLHTGDQGEIDPEGYLKLTGRVSDTFKSSKGKFIVPAPIEWGFAENKYIEQVCVTGLAIPQPLALVVLSEAAQKAPRENVETLLRQSLDTVNAALSGFERLKSLVVLSEPWSVENGILTPTMKIRRDVLARRYETLLQTWYDRNETIIWES
jgi:long-subunit acyl-CoA synthetase (AMP-forming)